MTKTFQKDSQYNQFDINDDGVVTDEELNRSERMMQIENMDKLNFLVKLFEFFTDYIW